MASEFGPPIKLRSAEIQQMINPVDDLNSGQIYKLKALEPRIHVTIFCFGGTQGQNIVLSWFYRINTDWSLVKEANDGADSPAP